MLIPDSKLQQGTRLRACCALKRALKLLDLQLDRGPRRTSRRGTAFDTLLPAAELGQCRTQRGMDLGRDLGGDLVERHPRLLGGAHQFPDQSVAFPEGHTRLDEEVCEI